MTTMVDNYVCPDNLRGLGENPSHQSSSWVIGGVDTHKDIHVAAVVDVHDQLLATKMFPTTQSGYRSMITWMNQYGTVVRVGVECTGSYGAGLTSFLGHHDIEVLEVIAPDRTDRRKRGKDDTLDAENAAHGAFWGKRSAAVKNRDSMIESLRVFHVTRKTAVAAQRIAWQMIQTQIVSAPEELRDLLRPMTKMKLIRYLAASRTEAKKFRLPIMATKIALKNLAKRYLILHDEVSELDKCIHEIIKDIAPLLREKPGIGDTTATQLLLTVGDNPARLKSEAAFAMLCGTAPIPASSGKKNRHRLNRGGDRAANSALHIIAVSRWRNDPKTKKYIEKKRAEGHSNPEILRCLKRYIAREVYYLIKHHNQQINTNQHYHPILSIPTKIQTINPT